MLRRALVLLGLVLLVPASASAQGDVGTPTPTPTPGPRVIDLSGSDAVWFVVTLGIGFSLLWFGITLYDRYSASRRLNMLLATARGRTNLTPAEIRAYSAAIQKPPPGGRGLTRTTLAFGLLTIVAFVTLALLVGDSSVTGDLLKTVVTALITALTTVLGFYFGAYTASDAAATGAKSAAAAVLTPGPPTGVTAVAGTKSATVSFTAPTVTGTTAIDGYRVTSHPGGITAEGTASPITVPDLTSGTEYTFSVQARNAAGYGPASEPSPAVTPT